MRAILTASFAALKPYATFSVRLELTSSACVMRGGEGRVSKSSGRAGMGCRLKARTSGFATYWPLSAELPQEPLGLLKGLTHLGRNKSRETPA
jgi:hypothetical protein